MRKISLNLCLIDRFVLTAHCVDKDTSDVDVVLGKHWYRYLEYFVSYVR